MVKSVERAKKFRPRKPEKVHIPIVQKDGLNIVTYVSLNHTNRITVKRR